MVRLAIAGALLQCLLSTTQSNLASNFERRVLDDDHVWIVHFTSLNNELCENCTKFLPYWQTLSKSLKRCVTGIVNVASRDGHELAEKLNIVPSSLPQVRIFNTMTSDVSPNGDAFGIPVITQQVATAKHVRMLLKDHLRGLAKDSHSDYFLKRRPARTTSHSNNDAAAFIRKNAISRFERRANKFAALCKQGKQQKKPQRTQQKKQQQEKQEKQKIVDTAPKQAQQGTASGRLRAEVDVNAGGYSSEDQTDFFCDIPRIPVQELSSDRFEQVFEVCI